MAFITHSLGRKKIRKGTNGQGLLKLFFVLSMKDGGIRQKIEVKEKTK